MPIVKYCNICKKATYHALYPTPCVNCFPPETIDRVKKENKELKSCINNLLQSADCSWENLNQGHDWCDAVEKARQILKEGK